MEAAAKLNSLEVPKLSMLLIRFYYILCSSQEYLFTNEEKEKLLKSLNVSRKGLNDLLEIIKSILYESVQNTIQPMALRELLISKGMRESHAQVFSEQWAENGKMVVDVMKKISLAKWQMRGLSWEFHAEASSTNTARQKHPIAVMNVSLFEPNIPLEIKATKHNTDINAKDLVFQMDKKELYKFYNELEKIQVQIDSLK